MVMTKIPSERFGTIHEVVRNIILLCGVTLLLLLLFISNECQRLGVLIDFQDSSNKTPILGDSIDNRSIESKTKEPIKVSCVGDSITAYGCVSSENMTYVSQLQRVLGDGYDVTNYGDSGKTMLKNGICTNHDYTDCPSAFDQNFTTPCSYWDTSTFRDALNSQPDIVTIMLGTNDAKECNWFGPPNGSPVGAGMEYRSAYLDMISRFRSLPSNPVVLLAIPPPLVSEPGFPNTPPPFHMNPIVTNQILRELIPSIANESLVPSNQIVDVWSALGGVDGYENSTMTCDGCHPRDDGASLIAKAFASTILGIVNATTEGSGLDLFHRYHQHHHESIS